MLPAPNPTHKALSDLALSLKGAVLMGHSESGRAPLEAALINASGIRGMIVIEPPGGCGMKYTDQQIATLARLPILIVFGDHLTVAPRNWRGAFENCKAFIARINAAKGNAKMLYPPDLGIHGNSHMIMQDKNNLADRRFDPRLDRPERGHQSHELLASANQGAGRAAAITGPKAS